MAARLRTYVHVQDKDGESVVFGPDDVVPAWARKAITNPDVWESNAKNDDSHTDE